MLVIIDKPGINRFLRYSGIGVGTFIVDLCLLFLFIDVFHLHYVLSAGIAFLIAVSLNYVVSRIVVFGGSATGVVTGYGAFLALAGVGLFATTFGMYVMVTHLTLHYVPARVIVAGFVGVWNYLMNLYVTFRVVGKHESRHGSNSKV